jgi:uncharacterized protein
MGAKKKVIRVVLDTNVLVSALLFSGELSKIYSMWKKRIIVPLFTRETFDEFQKVLVYPKFSLSTNEIKSILSDEVLPYFEVVDHTDNAVGVCRDPDDDKFISCALSGGARVLVSGDRDLIGLGHYGKIHIMNPAEFIKKLS